MQTVQIEKVILENWQLLSEELQQLGILCGIKPQLKIGDSNASETKDKNFS